MIRFRLDEAGASLRSFAYSYSSLEDEEEKLPREFIFDRPFLLYVHKRHSANPYFAMWVENTELLEIASN